MKNSLIGPPYNGSGEVAADWLHNNISELTGISLVIINWLIHNDMMIHDKMIKPVPTQTAEWYGERWVRASVLCAQPYVYEQEQWTTVTFPPSDPRSGWGTPLLSLTVPRHKRGTQIKKKPARPIWTNVMLQLLNLWSLPLGCFYFLCPAALGHDNSKTAQYWKTSYSDYQNNLDQIFY